jgi:tol-pal system protein YbgF
VANQPAATSQPAAQHQQHHEAEFAPLAQGLEALRRDLATLQSDVAALRTELSRTRAEIEAATRVAQVAQQDALDALARRLTVSEQRLGQLAGTVGGVETTVDGLADQVARLEAVSAPVPRSRLAAGGKGTRSATATAGPEELFDRAMESFRAGELGQAVLDFEEFVARNPRHSLVPSAQFWIGEAYFRARDFENAATAYQKAVTLAPKGEKTADALLRLGLALRALKREDRAREAWGRLVRDFGDSEAAQRGRVLLRESTRSPDPKTSP